MNPSYFRIKLNQEQAISRFSEWIEQPCKEKYETDIAHSIDLCLDESKQWKGICLYIYETDGWTVFEDVSGFLSDYPVEAWLEFAKKEEFIFAGYNDAILYGEFVAIKDEKVLKEFSEYDGEIVNNGQYEVPIESWIDVAEFIDEDELFFSDKGIVLIF